MKFFCSYLLILSASHHTTAHQLLSMFSLLSSLLLLLSPLSSAECPEGWWRAGAACYMTSQRPMTWFNAQEV